MTGKSALRTTILTVLNEWPHLDSAIRKDAFIEVDIIGDTVRFIDPDQFFKYDLEDPEQLLSFFTINPWNISDYNEAGATRRCTITTKLQPPKSVLQLMLTPF